MSAVRPYYLPGTSQLRRFEDQAQGRLRDLIARWWPECDVEQSVRASAIESVAPGPCPMRYLLRRGEAWLALFGPDSVWQLASEAWLGCQMGSNSDLARTLERAFSMDLFCALAASEVAVSTALPMLLADVEWSQLPAGALQRGGGTVALELRIGEVMFTAMAGPELWYGATPSSNAKPALQTCADALQASSVRLSVQLPPVQIPLVDVAALVVGDFLNLQDGLSGHVQVTGPDLVLTLPATLGCREGRKAVRLQSAATNHSRRTEEDGKR